MRAGFDNNITLASFFIKSAAPPSILRPLVAQPVYWVLLAVAAACLEYQALVRMERSALLPARCCHLLAHGAVWGALLMLLLLTLLGQAGGVMVMAAVLRWSKVVAVMQLLLLQDAKVAEALGMS